MCTYEVMVILISQVVNIQTKNINPTNEAKVHSFKGRKVLYTIMLKLN